MEITNNLVPHYNKEAFDGVATEFLEEYCPEALSTPMRVPISRIAKKKLGLKIRKCTLTEDLSIYGQICFETGSVQIYDAKGCCC